MGGVALGPQQNFPLRASADGAEHSPCRISSSMTMASASVVIFDGSLLQRRAEDRRASNADGSGRRGPQHGPGRLPRFEAGDQSVQAATRRRSQALECLVAGPSSRTIVDGADRSGRPAFRGGWSGSRPIAPDGAEQVVGVAGSSSTISSFVAAGRWLSSSALPTGKPKVSSIRGRRLAARVREVWSHGRHTLADSSAAAWIHAERLRASGHSDILLDLGSNIPTSLKLSIHHS